MTLKSKNLSQMSLSCDRLIDSSAKLSEDAVELNDDSSQRVSDLADIRPNPGRFPEVLIRPLISMSEIPGRRTEKTRIPLQLI